MRHVSQPSLVSPETVLFLNLCMYSSLIFVVIVVVAVVVIVAMYICCYCEFNMQIWSRLYSSTHSHTPVMAKL